MWTRLTLTLTLIAFVLTGCSYFKKQERLDLAPFAERTVSLAADIEYGGHLKYFFNYSDFPEQSVFAGDDNPYREHLGNLRLRHNLHDRAIGNLDESPEVFIGHSPTSLSDIRGDRDRRPAHLAR